MIWDTFQNFANSDVGAEVRGVRKASFGAGMVVAVLRKQHVFV